MPTANPYQGPRPFETGERIYGRAKEIESLYSLLVSGRIVVLHSPSAAGNRSLVPAGLIPKLKDLFDIWGPVRVKEPATDPAANRFTYSTLSCLEESPTAATLADYAQQRRTNTKPVLLIFDQFEEVLTTDPLNFDAIKGFFEQLGDLLHDPSIWALFLIREEFLGALDPYRNSIPTQLNNRFRIDHLSLDAAKEAIFKPAARAGRTFTAPALDNLIDDLATIQVQQPDGTSELITGYTVETAHLQVVCSALWLQLPEDQLTIDVDDIQAAGDVSTAMADYYAARVREIADGDQTLEADIREWIEERLITSGGLRGQVLLAPEETEGLPNYFIDALVDALLLRREHRANSIWFELSHDRLVHSVTISNDDFDASLKPFERAVRIWLRNGQNSSYLLTGDELARATSGIDPGKLDDPSTAFFNASINLDLEHKQRLTDQLRLERYASSLTIAAGTVTAIAIWAVGFVLVAGTDEIVFLMGLVFAALFGASLAWALRNFYRNQREKNRILQLLTRAHRDDPSLQPGDYSYSSDGPPSQTDAGLLDLWDTTTLAFVPYWILLTVAGADGRFTARELRALKDKKDIDAFIEDGRPAAIGLLDAARILNTKMDPAEAAAFRARMNKLAASIDRNQSNVKDSINFVKVALEGGDISKLRPSITRFYAQSGLYSWPRYFLALFLISLLTLALNYPYEKLHSLFHWAINPVLALVYGLIMFAAITVAITQTKLRNRIAMASLAITSSLIFLFVGPSIPEYLCFAISMLMIFALSKQDVFCERCNLWAEDNTSLLVLKTPSEATLSRLLESLKSGDLHMLQSFIVPPDYTKSSSNYLTVDIKYCAKCQDFQTLNLNQVAEDSTDTLIENLLISSKQLFWLKSQQPTSST